MLPVATLSLVDATTFVGGYDLTTDLNQVTLELSVDELDSTTFGGGGYRQRTAGLRSVSLSHQGFQQYANPDSTLFADLATERVFTCSPDGEDGSVAYSFKARGFTYTPITGAVGEMAGFSGSAMGSDGVGVVRGQLLLPKTTVAGVVTGTGVEMGAVLAAESVYTSVHVFSAGTTADVIVESDDNSGFTTATTRSTTTVSAAGGTWVAPVAGAIADTFWRVRTANVTGSFIIAVSVSIQ